MSRAYRESGFSLVTALFLLVVLAMLMAYMVNLSGVQHATVAMSVQGARALQAARSGLEYGVYRALNGNCNASETINFTAAEPALQPFTVSLSCSSTAHVEGTTTVNYYELTALAESGVYISGSNANPDYVSRQIRVTVSNQPP